MTKVFNKRNAKRVTAILLAVIAVVSSILIIPAMTDKNYNELLRKRVLQENREFNEELEKLPAHEALSRAYEKVIKEDLVCSISEGNLTNTEARALLRLKHPLDELYSEWLHNDMSYNDMLRATIKDRATSAVREMKSQALDDR